MNPQDEEDHKLPQVEPTQTRSTNDSSVAPPSSQGVTKPATQLDNTQASQPQLTAQKASVADPAMVADDVDLIEKAWVEKAKDIVKGTVGDPHTQNERMSQMKVDYMKKRYGRDIKTGE